ncbi:MAG: hypothetical protein MJ252_12910 [archaeon]|nr:hypothetical protein [archaeon]
MEKDNLNKTMQKFIDFNIGELGKLEKEKSKIEDNARIATELNINQNDIIDLEINGGTKITTSRQTLTKYPNSYLAKMIMGKNSNRYVIERQSKPFINLIYYLRNKQYPYFNSQKEKNTFLVELEYWQIPSLEPKIKPNFVFDKEWCAQTLQIEPNLKIVKKKGVQHGIVFCKPALDKNCSYIEFKVIMKTPCRGRSHLFLGLVDKSIYKYENLISTLWKDSPSSIYWDTWNTKLIKTDENGAQTATMNGYGCQCEDMETIFSIKYNENEKTVTFFKNGISMGVAFRKIQSGLTPSLDIWFEEGSVEIISREDIEERNFL